jgi:hypothetical protein
MWRLPRGHSGRRAKHQVTLPELQTQCNTAESSHQMNIIGACHATTDYRNFWSCPRGLKR